MRRTTVLVLMMAAISSCTRGEEAESTNDTTAAGTVQSAEPASAPATAAPAPVTDPQIAAIVVAANNVDIEGGRLAASRSTNPKVKAFAQRMIVDHNGVNKAAVALVTKLGVTPEENQLSRQQTEAGVESRASLQGLKGASFDLGYLANEVTYHEDLLDAIDQVLVPSAQNGELKALLEQTRPAVVDHLRHARELHSSLGGPVPK